MRVGKGARGLPLLASSCLRRCGCALFPVNQLGELADMASSRVVRDNAFLPCFVQRTDSRTQGAFGCCGIITFDGRLHFFYKGFDPRLFRVVPGVSI